MLNLNSMISLFLICTCLTGCATGFAQREVQYDLASGKVQSEKCFVIGVAIGRATIGTGVEDGRDIKGTAVAPVDPTGTTVPTSGESQALKAGCGADGGSGSAGFYGVIGVAITSALLYFTHGLFGLIHG